MSRQEMYIIADKLRLDPDTVTLTEELDETCALVGVDPPKRHVACIWIAIQEIGKDVSIEKVARVADTDVGTIEKSTEEIKTGLNVN